MEQLLTPSPDAYTIIKQWESLRCRAYKALPTEKYYTIGYGHCGADVKKYQYCTVAQADELLHKDVALYSHKLATLNPTLTQRQYDALISLIFNIGWYSFRHSMTGVLVKQLNISTIPEFVARRIILWDKSAGIVVLGLQRRRVFEANYFLGYEAFYLQDGKICEHPKPLLRTDQ